MTLVQSKNELGEKLLGGDKSEAVFAARLSWGYFCREATIYLYRTTGFANPRILTVADLKFLRIWGL